jgi:quercetin dioxygenase-like cupin family protein
MRKLGILAGLAVLVFAGVADATPPRGGATSIEIARGTFAKTAIDEGKGDTVVARNIYPPKASSGWHAHPGPVVIGVEKGKITLTRTQNGACVTTTYHAGEVFREQPGPTYIGRNRGDKKAVLIATFFGVPQGGSTRIERDAPACAH